LIPCAGDQGYFQIVAPTFGMPPDGRAGDASEETPGAWAQGPTDVSSGGRYGERPGAPGGVRVSPVIPTVANLLLAALWGLSVFAGWGLEAFCSAGEESEACRERLGAVPFASAVFAVTAALCMAGAWLGPVARRDPGRYAVLTATALICWVAAEGVLFVGGVLNQHPG
jgi:hypothetical protein